jgi:hypothetical protein
VVGVLLTSIGTSFLLAHRTPDSSSNDTAAGLVLGVPGALAILNGIGILTRSPYDETWATK